jgi:hypothetical protein
VCVATADAEEEVQDGAATCLSSHDRGDYDYISVGKDGLVLVSVKPMSLTRLSNRSLQ